MSEVSRERVYRGDDLVTHRTDGACDAITFTDTPTATGGDLSSSLTFERAAGPGWRANADRRADEHGRGESAINRALRQIISEEE